MEKFSNVAGLVAPLDRDDVDTDAIIPKQFMKSIARTGFGPNLFDAWRYLDIGEPGMDCSKRPLNPDFVLNQARYRGASILLSRRNFGCGSSREHAPWALMQDGFRVIVAAGFAEIFKGNCYKNGLLPISLGDDAIQQLFDRTASTPGFQLHVDLQQQTVGDGDGLRYEFAISPFVKTCLLEGWDDIGLTLAHREEIRAFEQRRFAQRPWLKPALNV